jgi:hypothetical protein
VRCGLQRFHLFQFVKHHRRQFLAARADAALAALVAAVAAVLRGHTALLETVATAVSLRRQEEDASAEERWAGASDAPGTVLELLQHTRRYRRQVCLDLFLPLKLGRGQVEHYIFSVPSNVCTARHSHRRPLQCLAIACLLY